MVSGNKFRRLPTSDRVLVGAAVGTYTPKVVEVYGDLGLDYAFLDLEHDGFGPLDSDTLENYTRAAELAGVELLVRLPSGSAETHPSRVRKALDAGVRNLLIPRVETAEEVRAAVRAGRFHHGDDPGARGIGGSRVTTYGGGLDPDFVDRADETVAVGAMIETADALADIEAILGVTDLAFVVPGPMDLAGALGYPGQHGHEAVVDAVAEVEAACTDAGVPFGWPYVDPAEAAAYVDRGYQFLTVGSELSAAREVFGRAIEDVDAAVDPGRRP
jgi:2-dehydro-3-deoxyglucarate aldolase